MRILMITDNDPAGMAIAFCNAINRYTEHSCRLISTQERYGFAYQKDIHLPDIHDDDFGEVESLLQKADVFHFHMLRDENSHLGPLVIRDYVQGKPILHHHHGHPDYILNAERFNEKYKQLRRRVIVSTPDLLRVADDARWVPNLVPISDVAFMPRYEPSLPVGNVKVCQSPTRKFDKHTWDFTQVMERLTEKTPGLETVLIERTPYLECLRIKRGCHICFDHMRGWFGIASLESLSHGKPVVAGLDELTISKIVEFTGTDSLPWVIATDAVELLEELGTLVADRDKRLEIGVLSRRFMEDCWSEQHVLRVLLEVYRSL
jgi:glycosyltransferase involved in cell wall biosynthesis